MAGVVAMHINIIQTNLKYNLNNPLIYCNHQNKKERRI